VLNKKFRIAQKVLDREAAYVTQAGHEIEKLLSVMPPVSISPSVSNALFDAVEVAKSLSESMDQAGGSDHSSPSNNGKPRHGTSLENDIIMEDSEGDDKISTIDGEKSSDPGDNKRPKGAEVAKLLGVLVDRLGSMKRKVCLCWVYAFWS